MKSQTGNPKSRTCDLGATASPFSVEAMQRAPFASAFLLALAWSPMARGQPSAEALQLYNSGEFLAAANLASVASTPEDLTFVSRALLAACAVARARSDIDATLIRAAQNAQSALVLDPHSVEAHIDLALAYGMMGKRANLGEALRRDYAGRGRRLIDEALALEPNNARAHALLGAWHFEVLRRGGGIGAAAYGARLSLGLAEFRRGQALAPKDPLIPLQFAVALLQRDPIANAVLAQNLLARALGAPAGDALEAAAQDTARRLMRALAAGPNAARRAARETNI